MISKFIRFFLLVPILVCSAQAVEATDIQNTSLCIDKITTNEEGVFLYFKDAWLHVDAMEVTAEGIFVLKSGDWKPLDVVLGQGYYTWTCSACQTINVQGVSKCSNCKKPH